VVSKRIDGIEKPLQPLVVAAQQRNNERTLVVGEVINPYGMFNGIWIPESLVKSSDIPASAKLLFGQLARFAGKYGRCFPSVSKLAVELGITRRQVERLTALLCKAGFLRKDAQYRANGSQTSNAYFFLYHASLTPARPMVDVSNSDTQPQQSRQARGSGTALTVFLRSKGLPANCSFRRICKGTRACLNWCFDRVYRTPSRFAA
jgi:GntR family transcriptional regulator